MGARLRTAAEREAREAAEREARSTAREAHKAADEARKAAVEMWKEVVRKAYTACTAAPRRGWKEYWANKARRAPAERQR